MVYTPTMDGWRRLGLISLAGLVFALTTHAKMSQYEPAHSPTRYLAKATKLDPSRSGRAEAAAPLLTPGPDPEQLVELRLSPRPDSRAVQPLAGALVSPTSRPPPRAR